MSIRKERVAEEIKHQINTAMSRDLSELNLGLVTVTSVVMSPDLKIAKIYLTFLGSKETPEKAIAKIDSRKKHIRYELGKHLKLKFTPDIMFFYDDTAEYAEHINKILRDIKK
jgi:ribosome-binding factor A